MALSFLGVQVLLSDLVALISSGLYKVRQSLKPSSKLTCDTELVWWMMFLLRCCELIRARIIIKESNSYMKVRFLSPFVAFYVLASSAPT